MLENGIAASGQLFVVKLSEKKSGRKIPAASDRGFEFVNKKEEDKSSVSLQLTN